MADRICDIEGCGRRHEARGMCHRHYLQIWRSGALPESPPIPDSDDARIWPRIEKTPTCWLWTGARVRNGYGTARIEGRNGVIHRWVYEQLVGPIPAGMQLDHLCRVRHCCNPDHLEPVTHTENCRRARASRQRSGTGWLSSKSTRR